MIGRYSTLLATLVSAFFAFLQPASAQTELKPGELVITGLNTSLAAEDWVFAPLVDLEPGTEIKFTDNGWRKGSGFRLTEGVALYIVPAGGVKKGQLISFRRNRADFQVSGALVFEPNGDQLLAYQGAEAQPAFIMGLSTKGAWGDQQQAGTSDLPTELHEGKEALTLAWDNAYMDEQRKREGTADKLQEWFNDVAKWSGSDVVSQPVPVTDLVVEEGQVPDADEEQALVDLYNATEGWRWRQRQQWLVPPRRTVVGVPEFAYWQGVTVTNGDVTALVLPDNGLVGELPVSLGRLTQLRVLDLSGNGLQGTVPDSLGSLRQLRQLVLNNNQLTGDLPALLGHLGNLRTLALHHNLFSGPLAAGMLRRWDHLQQVLLGNNQLSGPLSEAIGQLRHVQTLDLSANQLRGALPDSLAQLGAVQEVLLQGNQFTGALPTGWAQLPQVQTLLLGANRLSGAGAGGVGTAAALAHTGRVGQLPVGYHSGAAGGFKRLLFVSQQPVRRLRGVPGVAQRSSGATRRKRQCPGLWGH